MGFRSTGGGLGGTGLLTGPPSESIDIGDDARQGISDRVALIDHQHPFPAPAVDPADLAAAPARGSSSAPARANHKHRHLGADHQPGGFADLSAYYGRAPFAARADTGNVPAGGTVDVVVGFSQDFPDLNYTVEPAVEEASAGNTLQARKIVSRAVGSVTVRVANSDALVARAGTLHVLAYHDSVAVARSASITATQATGVEARTVSVQAAGTGKGKFVWSVINNNYVNVPNPTLYVGYNLTAGGTRILAGENGLAWGIEADYNDGSGDNKMEVYAQYNAASTTTHKRPFFFQFNRTNDALSNATLMGSSTGGLGITWDDGSVQGQLIAQFIKMASRFLAPTLADNSVYVDAATGFASFFHLGYNGAASASTGLRLGTVSATESRIRQGGRDVLFFYSTPIGAAGQAISVGVQDNAAVATFAVGTSNAALKGVVVRGKAGQTGSLFEAQDSANAVLSRFNHLGYFMTRKTAAPADADLANSEGAIWWDPTPATGGFRYKGKDSAGEILSGSL